jgi:GNAT superfamily N-acetyltransferase
MIHADLALAKRLEAVEARGARLCAESVARLHPEIGAAHMEFAGGTAALAGKDTPLSQVMGAGLSGLVSDDEIDAMETFYCERGAPPRIELSPFADLSLVNGLMRRGYTVNYFKNILVRTLREGEILGETPKSIRIAEVGDSNRDLCASLLAQAFSDGAEPLDLRVDLFQTLLRTGATAFLAECDGEAAGAALMDVHGGLAATFASAVLPQFRKRGVHTALIRARLQSAVERGCDLAKINMLPGAQSQRNAERLGFRVAYTRVSFHKHQD